MLHGARRFTDIAAAVPDMSDKMLAGRLKELEAEGIVTRNVLPETPVRVEYELTEKGRSLEPVVATLAKWADRWIGPCPDARLQEWLSDEDPASRPVTSEEPSKG